MPSNWFGSRDRERVGETGTTFLRTQRAQVGKELDHRRVVHEVVAVPGAIVDPELFAGGNVPQRDDPHEWRFADLLELHVLELGRCVVHPREDVAVDAVDGRDAPRERGRAVQQAHHVLPPVRGRPALVLLVRDELPRVGSEIGPLRDGHLREDAVSRMRNPGGPDFEILLGGGLAVGKRDRCRDHDG
jgi:hypothetical protein